MLHGSKGSLDTRQRITTTTRLDDKDTTKKTKAEKHKNTHTHNRARGHNELFCLRGFVYVVTEHHWDKKQSQLYTVQQSAKPHLEQLGRDEEILLSGGPAGVEHDAAEHLPFVFGVHALVDLVHHPERTVLQVLRGIRMYKKKKKEKNEQNERKETKKNKKNVCRSTEKLKCSCLWVMTEIDT